MFASGNLGTPPPQIPFYNNRVLGAIVLLIALILCLATVLMVDAAILVPYNATSAVTQTWQAGHPGATDAGPTRRPQSSSTATPGNFDMNASENGQISG